MSFRHGEIFQSKLSRKSVYFIAFDQLKMSSSFSRHNFSALKGCLSATVTAQLDPVRLRCGCPVWGGDQSCIGRRQESYQEILAVIFLFLLFDPQAAQVDLRIKAQIRSTLVNTVLVLQSQYFVLGGRASPKIEPLKASWFKAFYAFVRSFIRF